MVLDQTKSELSNVHFPNYRGQSIVNLMSHLARHYGDNTNLYDGLTLNLPNLTDFDQIVLLVVDGMGYDYVQSQPGLFREHCVGPLTSVFPSTTATSITAFFTGQAPQQHGITGWFTYLQEIEQVTAVLPCMPRGEKQSLSTQGVDIQRLYNHPVFFDGLNVESGIVAPNWIIGTEFNQAHTGSAIAQGYESLDEMVEQLSNTLKQGKKQYIYAYWPEFDHLSHVNGNGSERVAEHFHLLQSALAQLVKVVRQTKTLVLITADHGFIDTERERMLVVNEHPHLHDCLRLPLCGEPRSAFCYVHDDKHEQFVDYLENEFSDWLKIEKSTDVLQQGAFGLGEVHPKLHQRIGDYTLIMKENYVIKDWLPTETPFFHRGVHGGTSAQEMYVPLIALY